MIQIQMLIGALSIIMLILTLELIRKERLREQYAILWVFTWMATLIFSLSPDLFLSRFITRVTGIFYLSAVVLIAFLFLLLIVLHFSVVISKLTNQNKELAQKHALLELELNQLKKNTIPPDPLSS